MKDLIIEIVVLSVVVVVTGLAMVDKQRIAREACDISSYEAYINTKAYCDLLEWDEVKKPA